jgi:GTPase KRas protein
LVYSITSRASFESLSTFHNQILRVKDVENFPVVIIGNKCDLEQDREVPQTEAKQFADSIGSPFFEVKIIVFDTPKASAKTRVNVEECFNQVVREIRKYLQNVANEDSKEKKKKINLFEKLKSLNIKIPKTGECTLL